MPAVWIVKAKIRRMSGKLVLDVTPRMTYRHAFDLIEELKRKGVSATMEEVSVIGIEKTTTAKAALEEITRQANERQLELFDEEG